MTRGRQPEDPRARFYHSRFSSTVLPTEARTSVHTQSVTILAFYYEFSFQPAQTTNGFVSQDTATAHRWPRRGRFQSNAVGYHQAHTSHSYDQMANLGEPRRFSLPRGASTDHAPRGERTSGRGKTALRSLRRRASGRTRLVRPHWRAAARPA